MNVLGALARYSEWAENNLRWPFAWLILALVLIYGIFEITVRWVLMKPAAYEKWRTTELP